MNLKSFGCSFIFGSELSDEGRRKPYDTGSQLTWPAHLAQHLNYNYLCYARPAAGNLQIAERALSELSCDNEDNLYVISWTYIDRFDYIGSSPRWPGTPWTTILPVDTEPVAEMYYKNLHSEYRDKLTTLIYIKSVLDKLKQKNCQFIMTYMDDLLFDQRWHTTPAVIDLQEYIRPYMTQFDNVNFLQWSKNNNFQISPQNNHPLEEAHQAAGDYMIKVFHKQNTVDR
jgi:hypothetical protein